MAGGSVLKKRDNPTIVLEAFEALRGIVREIIGTELMLAYGDLLAAVRNGSFLEHEEHSSLDVFYFTKLTDPDVILLERDKLLAGLQGRGYGDFNFKKYRILLTCEETGVRFDLNFAWLEGDRLLFSFGQRYLTKLVLRDLFPTRERALHGHVVQIPGRVERILHAWYGPNWRIPDHGAQQYGATIKRAKWLR